MPQNMPSNPAVVVKQKSPWIKIMPAVVIVYVLLCAYNYHYRGGYSDAVWSESLAAVGGVFIGLSLAMSSLSYFFDFADGYLRYRKQYGLYGFYLALLYSFSLQFRFPDKYYYGLIDRLYEPEVILGLSGMFLLGYMALISNKYGLRVLGNTWWRRSLRLGYVVYILFIIRAYIVEESIWMSWFQNPNILYIPPRFLLSIYASLIIVARVLLEVSLKLRGKSIEHK